MFRVLDFDCFGGFGSFDAGFGASGFRSVCFGDFAGFGWFCLFGRSDNALPGLSPGAPH